MAYENKAGLGVNNHYGARDSGGTRGVYKTEGYYNEFVINLDQAALPTVFPRNVEVIGVDETFVTGDVTALTIGGVSVLLAAEAAPVAIVTANTGAIAQTGGTAGYIIVRYKTAPAGVVVA